MSTIDDGDAERLDYALGSDFESELLDWASETNAESDKERISSTNDDQHQYGWEAQSTIDFFGTEQDSSQQEDTLNTERTSQQSITDGLDENQQRRAMTVSTEASSTIRSSSEVTASSSAYSQSTDTSRLQQNQRETGHGSAQLHPQAIQSSANCPPYFAGDSSSPEVTSSTAAESSTGQNLNQAVNMQNAALLPLAMNALAAGVSLPFPMMLSNPTQQSSRPRAPSATRNDAGTSESHGSQPVGFPPPFLLFDAPIELRANFEATQRALGIPVISDNNSFHFGMSVNGFHPQSLEAGPRNKRVKLMDARHVDVSGKRIKNAKEQQRAQKIADLIDELRVKMEKDGWKVGYRSKLNTLSCCADYVKHLAKLNKEKEEKIKQAKCDLEAARNKIADDKAQQDPSEPESTTSSLTVSSESGTVSAGKSGKVSDDLPDSSSSDERVKRPCVDTSLGGRQPKKPRLQSQESALSSSTTSGEETTSKEPNIKRLSMDYASSSVSDITDSNKGSSTNTTSGSDSHSGHSSAWRRSAEGSLSSDAAVAVAKHKRYGDLLLQKRGKQSVPDGTSLDDDFVLDYEEVFLKSNVPQLLASTDGRIVTWNNFFLQATGLQGKQLFHSSIFSLVKPSKLSSLFEIVAQSLRSSPKKVSQENNYLAMTLPCISFRACEPKQLYITVTLMADEDRRKRCFHCVLTDCPGTNESLAPISKDFLSMLFRKQGADTLITSKQKGTKKNDADYD